MAAFNLTPSDPSTFILNGTPGLEAAHVWIPIPFCTLYLLCLLGNFIVIFVISLEQTLHKPMYLLLCLLALTDISLSTLLFPNTLCLILFPLKKITLECCLTQVFVLYAISSIHSAVLLTMAFDRYVAICDPLRYTTILTNALIAKLGLMGLIRAVLLLFPLPFLLQNLPSCDNQVIPHIYCEFTTLIKMSCVNTTGWWKSSIVILVAITVLDVTFIGVSYVLIIRAVLKISSKKAYEKALSTCTTHISVMLTSYTPFLFYVLTKIFSQGIPAQFEILLLSFFLHLPPVLNPIIYGIRNKELSHKIGKYICRM